MHHTWKHRFETALRNRNWKKILAHETVEYTWLGSWVIALGGTLEAWIIGVSGAFFIHLIVFEAIDALHKKYDENNHKNKR